jgi:hypothetical protein
MREQNEISTSLMKTFSMGLMLVGLFALYVIAASAQTPTPTPTPGPVPNSAPVNQGKPPAQVIVAPAPSSAQTPGAASAPGVSNGLPTPVPTPGPPQEATLGPPECARTITADVVAFDQIIFFNRFGSFDPGGMMYALKRDVVAIDPSKALGPDNVQFRPDKRPRPLVLRANQGDCLLVSFTNWLTQSPNDVDNKVFPVWPANQPYRTPTTPVKLSHNDTPATRTASMHVNGLDYVDALNSDGSYVGKNASSLAPSGQTVSYNWYAGKQGQYLVFSTAATSGGEGDGGQITHGLFGMINVEPTNSIWYRSQVTAAQMQAAKTGTNANGTPILNYEAVDANGDPILNILKGTEIIHADLNAIITDPSGTLQEDCTNAPPSGTCGQPFREFSVIFHDELESGAPAFSELLIPLFHGVRDGFGINYGSSGLGAEVLANRKAVGPAANCPECNYEEFFLESPANGDPAVLVKYDSAGHAIDGLFQDDPGNVHHSYILDPVRFRNVHAGPKETHVFHLHQHQWLQSSRDPNSTYLDSQTISPGASFTYEIQYGGGGNRNVGSPGDSIFHCHLYPHFAQGMWELWRNHDTFEDGTIALNKQACKQTRNCTLTGKSFEGRNLADGEVATGIPQPALVPIPYLFLKDQNGTPIAKVGNLPMPRLDFEGYPFYMENQAGHRSPQAPFGRELDVNGLAVGGLPRHRVHGGTALTGTAAVPADQLADPIAQRVNSRVDSTIAPFTFGLAKKLDTANLEFLPEDGTTAEKAAMAHHNGQEPGGTPIVIRQQGVAIPSWTAMSYPTYTAWASGSALPTIFAVNGRIHQPGAPYSDPCPDTFVDDNGQTRAVPLRKYRAAWVQLDGRINAAGWHDRQMRIAVLEQDVANTINGTATTDPTRATEPLFFRANSGDCIDYRVTNLTRSNLNLDDFQVFQGTDIIGQHIHLVKFDVTSSDGAGNGWNYESGGFSPEAVRERIDAFNKYQQVNGGSARFTAKANPSVPDKPEFLGAQTHIERWWADPLVNRNGRDRTLRTVFTHDHFSPSGHQHHGLYAGLVIEPTDSNWTTQGGTPLYTRPDGGPTTYSARIIAGPGGQNSFREFMLELGDFALVYTQDNIPVNPPNHKDFPLPVVIGFPVLLDPSQNPKPESISAADPGTQVINYRNEPLPLRIGTLDASSGKLVQKSGYAGDLAFAFSTDVHGDPVTPILPSYPNDKVQVRILQGAQEEQHVMNVHGHKWLFEPGTPQDPAAVNNSGYTNAQHVGISEHFEFDMSEKTLPLFSNANTADYLYSSAASDNLWDGMWGLMRTYATVQPGVMTLPNNTAPSNVPASPFKGSICPDTTAVPKKDFYIEARLATDLAGPSGIVYNDRFGFHDPAGIVYVESQNVAPIQQGTKKLEPLVLRANAGDCVRVHLTNNLPATLPEYDSWNFMPPITPAFNFNQVQTSNRVSLHSQLLAYDVGSSDGATIGSNPNQTVAPGETKTYTWYAGKIINIDPVNNTVTVTPIEFGATGLRDYGDVIKHSSHGLIGSLIIEPQGANWTQDAGTTASATIKDVNGSILFREFVVQYQSDLTMKNAAGTSRFIDENNVTTTFTNSGMKNTRDADDAEDSGLQGFNYRNEPLWARLGLPSDTDLNTLRAQDFTNTLSSLESNPGCGGPCGDPETPVFLAQAGTQVRFRILDSADHPRQHGFTLFGHHWQFEPWLNNSQTLGDNPDSFEVGSYSGIGPTRHLNILTKAGGTFAGTGDYLYRTQESFKFSGGLWGIFRVSNTAPAVDAAPLGRPNGLTANLTPGGQVALNWTPSTSGTVDHYQVERAQSVYGPYTPVSSTTTTSMTDATTMNGIAYLYRVRALDTAGNRSPSSNTDMATTIVFTDNPIVPGVTVIKAVHLTELRQGVDAVRALAGLDASTWTDPNPTGVPIKAVHIQELRTKLDEALSLLSRPLAPYTDPNLTTAIRVLKVHIEELRQRVK